MTSLIHFTPPWVKSDHFVSAFPPLPSADLDHVLAFTFGQWESLRGKRIFVTGGTGFFGGWLVETFLRANRALCLGAEMVLLSRNPKGFLHRLPHVAGQPGLTFVNGDIRDFSFPPGEFECMIHAATEASAKLNEDFPEQMLDVILAGTYRALAFAKQAGVRKFLLTSSGAIYGTQPASISHLPESYSGAPDPLSPCSAYGIGKRTVEHICALYGRRNGIQVKIARCFAFVGPHLPLDMHFAIGNFMRDGLAGKPICVNSDGTPVRSYLYAADLAVALWQVLFSGANTTAYNIGSGEAINLGDVARAVADVFQVPVIVAREPVPGHPPDRYVPDVSFVDRELGVRQRVDLLDAIWRTARWHQDAC